MWARLGTPGPCRPVGLWLGVDNRHVRGLCFARGGQAGCTCVVVSLRRRMIGSRRSNRSGGFAVTRGVSRGFRQHCLCCRRAVSDMAPSATSVVETAGEVTVGRMLEAFTSGRRVGVGTQCPLARGRRAVEPPAEIGACDPHLVSGPFSQAANLSGALSDPPRWMACRATPA